MIGRRLLRYCTRGAGGALPRSGEAEWNGVCEDDMTDSMYELVAYAMRFWFILVVVGILIAVIYISYKEYKEKKFVKSTIGQYQGYVEIVGGPKEFIGDRFGIRESNSIGSSRKSHIMLPDSTVLPTHALLYMEEGELVLSPMAKSDTRINSRIATQKHRLKTGDIFSIGDVDFYVYIKKTRLSHDD